MTTKLVYLTAGAGGMICGSCLHDNSLAKAIGRKGWDVQLVPFYTPIRTDEDDVSIDQVFFGGINVYLQQKVPLFRYLPNWMDGFLNNAGLIRRVTSRAVETNAVHLGAMALSMLKGRSGHQRKEVDRVVNWLINVAKPDVIVISNLLVAGFVCELKRRVDIPVIVTLQGDDVFLNALPDVERKKCLAQIRSNNQYVDAFIVHSEAFRSLMLNYFEISRELIHVTPLGLDVSDYRNAPVEPFLGSDGKRSLPRTIGYFARLAPEKGLQHLIGAFMLLKSDRAFQDVKLKIAGWVSPEHQSFMEKEFRRLKDGGLSDSFEYLGVVDRKTKLSFLKTIDVLSVPTEHEEPKGLFALEALASGTPVVLPRKGALTEIVEASGGGILFDPNDLGQFVESLKKILGDERLRQQLGQQGRNFVLSQRNEETMANDTMKIVERLLQNRSDKKLI